MKSNTDATAATAAAKATVTAAKQAAAAAAVYHAGLKAGKQKHNDNRQYATWSTDQDEEFIIIESLKSTINTLKYLIGVSGNPRLLPLRDAAYALDKQQVKYIDDVKKSGMDAITPIITAAAAAAAERDAANNVIVSDVATDFMDLWHSAIAEYLDDLDKGNNNGFKAAGAAVRHEVYIMGDRGRRKVKVIGDKTTTTTTTTAAGKVTTVTENLPEYKYVSRYSHENIENIDENTGGVIFKGDDGKKPPLYISPADLPETIELYADQKAAIKSIYAALTATQKAIFNAIKTATKSRKAARLMTNATIAAAAGLLPKKHTPQQLAAATELVRYNRRIIAQKAAELYPTAKVDLFSIVA